MFVASKRSSFKTHSISLPSGDGGGQGERGTTSERAGGGPHGFPPPPPKEAPSFLLWLPFATSEWFCPGRSERDTALHAEMDGRKAGSLKQLQTKMSPDPIGKQPRRQPMRLSAKAQL